MGLPAPSSVPNWSATWTRHPGASSPSCPCCWSSHWPLSLDGIVAVVDAVISLDGVVAVVDTVISLHGLVMVVDAVVSLDGLVTIVDAVVSLVGLVAKGAVTQLKVFFFFEGGGFKLCPGLVLG